MNKEQEIAEKLQNHRVEKSEKEEQKEGVTKFTNEELEEKAVVLEKAELEKIFDKNREDEVKFAQELNKKYGKGSLDIQTGIFTPVE